MNVKSFGKKMASAGMALLMTVSVAAVPASAAITVPNVNNIIGDVNRTVTETKRSIDNAPATRAQKADGYWSRHLSANGQTAYQLIVQAIQNGKTQTPVPDCPASEHADFGNIMNREHPELFYASKNFKWGEDTKNGRTTYTMSWTLDSNWKSEKNAVEQAVQNFLSGAPKSGSDYDKELYVHDKLVKDTHYQKKQNTVYNALVSHQANCDGYAYSMKLLLNKLNVPCEVVVGTATGEGAHAWNVVTLNGKNYLTDTCWDDPNPESSQYAISHRYFNLTASEMNRDHQADRPAEQNGCTDTSQNWYRKNGKYYASVSAAEQAIAEQMKTQKIIYAQLPDSASAKKVHDDWKAGVFSIPEGTSWKMETTKNHQNGFANGVVVLVRTK